MLTLPLLLAALFAGLVGGLHCVGMCGAVSGMLSRQFSKPLSTTVVPIHVNSKFNPSLQSIFLLHSGRLSAYMIIGAMFGGLGQISLSLNLGFSFAQVWFVIGNLALLFLGLSLLGVSIANFIQLGWLNKIQIPLNYLSNKLNILAGKTKNFPFVQGLAWGLLPCGLLYAVAPFALFSGRAWSGAVLMLIFGLAALPHLLLTQWMLLRLKQKNYLRYGSGLILVVIAIIGLWYFDMKSMPSFLCVVPQM
jgi:sulfite exporter TauE/SafE